jgi:hypothetical protein
MTAELLAPPPPKADQQERFKDHRSGHLLIRRGANLIQPNEPPRDARKVRRSIAAPPPRWLGLVSCDRPNVRAGKAGVRDEEDE